MALDSFVDLRCRAAMLLGGSTRPADALQTDPRRSMTPRVNSLRLERATRPPAGNKTPRTFLDFLVDDRSLFRQLSSLGFDFVSPLGWGDARQQAAVVSRLLRKKPGDLPSGRTAIFVCPECGDLGCGGVGTRIERVSDSIVWRDFAAENDRGLPNETETLAGLGPYTFHPTEYYAVFAGLERAYEAV
jgi:hypothetical protein